MSTTTTQAYASDRNVTHRIGMTVHLPDGGSVKLLSKTEGFEYGAPVWYFTGINDLGQTVTRWVYR